MNPLQTAADLFLPEGVPVSRFRQAVHDRGWRLGRRTPTGPFIQLQNVIQIST